MRVYKISKNEKKRIKKDISKGLCLTTIKSGDNKYTKTKKKSNSFNSNADYYITIDEIMHLKKSSDSKTHTLSANFIKIKNGKHPVAEHHDNVSVKYIACVVNKYMEFSKLDKREIKCKERDDNNKVYFIPVDFVCSMLPKKYSFTENISTELFDMEIFKYTGNISLLLSLSIFNISNEIYLTSKASVHDHTIRVIV